MCDVYPVKPSVLWSNLVRIHAFLTCTAYLLLEDGRAKMLKGDMADRLYQHLQDSDYSGQPSFINAFSAAQDRLGKYLYL